MIRPFWFALVLAGLAAAQSDDVESLRRSFANPPDEARILMRWWWFGPAVTQAGLEREMRLMQAAGIGGFEIQPVYPLSLDDPERAIVNLTYLSPEYLDALRFTGQKAKELGLRMDLTLGSGWPYGGPHIPVQQAAGRLRVERVAVTNHRAPLPALSAGEKLIAAFAGSRGITDVSGDVLRVPDGVSEVLFFISSRTGMMVKRPALGAEGFVLDHYDRAALDSHLKAVGDPQLAALSATPPYAVFCDSLEVFATDWTGGFLDEFRRRRGYDLKPHLPALASDDPASAGVHYDWGRTLTELANDRFLTHLLHQKIRSC